MKISKCFLRIVFISSFLFLIADKSFACNLPPIPDINNPFQQFICVGCAAELDGSTSYDQDEDGSSITTYYWWYGDDTNWHNDGETPTHTYQNAGIYQVWLYVKDDEGTYSLQKDNVWCWVYVYEVSKVEAGGKQTGQNLYLANDYLDEPDKRPVLWHWVQATLYPNNGVHPETFYWTPRASAPTLPRIDPNEWTITVFYAKDHGVYNIAAHCGTSVKDMNIVIEGVDIKTANITDSCEMTETYNIFLNDNFDQQLNPTNTPGHTTCYDVDCSDNSLAGDATDELGQISFNAQTYGDGGARVTFHRYSDYYIKLYDSNKNFLEFDDDGDGEPNYNPNAIGNTLYVEGTGAGTTTLTVNLWTQDGFTASDQLLIKVISLNLIASDPPVGSAHEICHKDVLFIPVNDNDSDGDMKLDFIDTYIPGGDPDIKAIVLASPTWAEDSDINGYITVTFPTTIRAYQNKDKTGWVAIGSKSFSFNELPVLIYLEGRSHSAVLDAKVKVVMTLDSGVKCRDEIRYTVLRVGLLATDLYGTVSSVYEENPGAFVHFNLDNDNNSINSVPSSKHPGADYNETSASVENEDDLKSLTMTLLPLLDFGSAVLSIPSGAKIWKSATKGSANLVLASGSKTWDLSVENQRNEFYSLCSTGVFVEGVNTGGGNIVLRYINPPGIEIYSDTVKYTFIAADCGDQPRTEAEDIYFWDTTLSPPDWNDVQNYKQRDSLEGTFGGLKRCEYSITHNLSTRPWSGGKRCTIPEYNCIAWSVDETNFWYNDSYIAHNYGDKDDNFELTDMDDFYYKKKGWSLITSGTDEEKAKQAEAMYYSGYHGARKKGCGCGAGKWIMYESKCGQNVKMEHVWDQLNGSTYETPIRFYK